MSIVKRSIALLFRDTHDFWVFFNIATRFVTKIITVGLLVKFLSESDLAAWYIFVALFGLSAILEGGATLVITRQVAEHLATKKQATSFFVIGILQAYKYLVMAVAVVALVFGLWWLSIAGSIHAASAILIAWVIFVVANCIALLSKVRGSIVQGAGEVATVQRNEIAASWFYLFVFLIIWFIFPEAGVLLPTLALLGSSYLCFYLNKRALRVCFQNIDSLSVKRVYPWLLAKSLGSETSSMMITMISFHLLTSVLVLLISAFEDASVVASYGLTMQIINIGLSFSAVWITSSFPRMAGLKGERVLLRKEFFHTLYRGIPVLFVFLMITILSSPFLLELWGSKTMILPTSVLAWLVPVIFMEAIFCTMFGKFLISQKEAGFVSKVSACFSVVFVVFAYMLYVSGFNIVEIFIMRLFVGVIFYYFPVVIRSRKYIGALL